MKQEMVIENSVFRKKEINKYTYERVEHGRVTDRALMGYVLITKGRLGRLLDELVFRGENGEMSDHFLVEGKIKVEH